MWRAFPIHWGTQRSLGWIQDSCLCTAHANPNQLWLQWSSPGLTTEQNVIYSVPDSLCPLCVEPGSSLLCLDCDAAGQQSHFFSSQAALSWLCCLLPALPQPAQHQPSGWLQGSPVLPGTSWHMEARFCSSLSSQHRPGHGFYCGQGNWESIIAKEGEGCKCVCNWGIRIWDAGMCPLPLPPQQQQQQQ